MYDEVERVIQMKKLLVLIIALSTFCYGAGLVATVATYPVNVNGQNLGVTVLNQNGTTYLPLKAVGQALGADVAWTGKSVEIQTVDVEKLKKACVMIFAENTTVGSQGSAVCWDYGEYLTAYHIVDNGQTNIRTSGNDKLTVDQTNETLDIATLDADDDVKPVKIGDSDDVKVGDKVLIIGSPKRAEDTVAYGTVSNPESRGMVVLTDGLGIATDGASGGAVFDLNGCLIGILVAEDNDKQGRFLVIPINEIRKAI